jgi:UTP--glucose-1-phosphate uridylyltransferase
MPPPVRCAVIPAAGRGIRLLPATRVVPKPLLPIVDTPAIQLTVEEARDAGIWDIVIVTSPGGVIESHFADDGQGLGFVVQEQALGLGHAVALAGERLPRGEAFAVLLPDVLPVGDGLRRMLDVHTTTGASTVALRPVPPEEVSAHGCVVSTPRPDGTREITELMEKPEKAPDPSPYILAGRYILSPAVVPILRHLEPGASGEIQLTDALARLVRDESIVGVDIRPGWLDAGTALGYLTASISLGLRRPELRAELIAHMERELRSAREGLSGP